MAVDLKIGDKVRDTTFDKGRVGVVTGTVGDFWPITVRYDDGAEGAYNAYELERVTE